MRVAGRALPHGPALRALLAWAFAEAGVSALLARPAAPASNASTTSEFWAFCSFQHNQCPCPTRLRFGVQGHWLEVGKPSALTECSPKTLKDPAHGQAKHCECALPTEGELLERTSPAVVPVGLREKPEVSCDVLEAAAGAPEALPEDLVLWQATAGLCGRESAEPLGEPGDLALDAQALRGLMRAWVDPRFRANYERAYDSSGWVQEAFVTYVGNAAPSEAATREKDWAGMIEQQARSVHLFSSRPLVVFHFGMTAPLAWDPERFPRLVLVHAPPAPLGSGLNFNWNKMRAMLLLRARAALQLDADQFVTPGADALFQRVREEVHADYPLPIMPVHWLSDKGPATKGAWWPRFCSHGDCSSEPDRAKRQTLRWGHAHPAWTFHALPFIGRWLRRSLRDESLPEVPGEPGTGLRVKAIPQDEDLLNMATWEENGTKQWCKYDVADPSELEAWAGSGAGAGGHVARDPYFYPAGAARAFYTAHHAVHPQQSARWITKIEERRRQGTLPPPILFGGSFYDSGAALRAAHPEVRCII